MIWGLKPSCQCCQTMGTVNRVMLQWFNWTFIFWSDLSQCISKFNISHQQCFAIICREYIYILTYICPYIYSTQLQLHLSIQTNLPNCQDSTIVSVPQMCFPGKTFSSQKIPCEINTACHTTDIISIFYKKGWNLQENTKQ